VTEVHSEGPTALCSQRTETLGGHVKKLVVLGAGAFAGLSVAASIGLFSPAVADSDPGGSNATNVVGVPYAQAIRILKSQGVKGFFGGAVGSDLPQSQCIVNQQRITSGGRMYLTLDCTEKAAKDAAGNAPAGTGGGGAPNVGGNGVTTVTPTPVGPQPGMNVPGA
jgi:hypothetical protein